MDAIAFCHRDFRTGNYLVDDGKLARRSRFRICRLVGPLRGSGLVLRPLLALGMAGAEAGGIGSRAAFYAGYEAGGGATSTMRRFVSGNRWRPLRWSHHGLEQAERHLGGRERSLELALTGLVALETEYDLLDRSAPARIQAGTEEETRRRRRLMKQRPGCDPPRSTQRSGHLAGRSPADPEPAARNSSPP